MEVCSAAVREPAHRPVQLPTWHRADWNYHVTKARTPPMPDPAAGTTASAGTSSCPWVCRPTDVPQTMVPGMRQCSGNVMTSAKNSYTLFNHAAQVRPEPWQPSGDQIGCPGGVVLEAP